MPVKIESVELNPKSTQTNAAVKISVKARMITWEDIENNFATWDAVEKAFPTWKDLENYTI